MTREFIASLPPGLAVQAVLLDGLLDAVAADERWEWLFDGWEALANVAKYLRRGSLLEALSQVDRARQRVFQLWAVGAGVPYPAYGLTSLLDEPAPSLPPGITETYAVPSAPEVTAAALATARLLGEAGARQGLDTPLRGYVTARLRSASDGS